MRLDSNGNFLGWDNDDDHEGFNISDILCSGQELDLDFINKLLFPLKNDIKMRVTLFGDRVLIKPDEKEKLRNGIVIPDSVRTNENPKGTVIKHGDGAYDERTGEFLPITVKEGDNVIYSATAQIQKSEEWDNLLLISEKDILTIIPKP